jgi:ketosteroid isomerase-like protein
MKKIRMAVIMSMIMMFMLHCSKTETQEDEVIAQVRDTDRAFSKMSAEQGMAKAFIEYADENVIRLNPRAYASIGKSDLIKSFEGDKFDGTLTWEPLKVSVDDKLAYTFGDWKMLINVQGRDTTLYGNYISVWKKQDDGTWKFVIDGGNPTPGPTPAEKLDLIK